LDFDTTDPNETTDPNATLPRRFASPPGTSSPTALSTRPRFSDYVYYGKKGKKLFADDDDPSAAKGAKKDPPAAKGAKKDPSAAKNNTSAVTDGPASFTRSKVDMTESLEGSVSKSINVVDDTFIEPIVAPKVKHPKVKNGPFKAPAKTTAKVALLTAVDKRKQPPPAKAPFKPPGRATAKVPSSAAKAPGRATAKVPSSAAKAPGRATAKVPTPKATISGNKNRRFSDEEVIASLYSCNSDVEEDTSSSIDSD